MIPISVIVMMLVIGKSEDDIGTVGGILCGVQLLPLIGSIIPTEMALKKTLIKMEISDEFPFIGELNQATNR